MWTAPKDQDISSSGPEEGEPSSGLSAPQPEVQEKAAGISLLSRLRGLLKVRTDMTLHEAIKDYMEDEPQNIHAQSPHDAQERHILANTLKLRDVAVDDVMIPRAEIVAIEEGISQPDLLALLATCHYSRLPVYRESLDDVIGTVHVKDMLSALARGETINISSILSEVPFVSPSMRVMDLILEMRRNRRHMAMVLDEFGGIDGLVTIGDVIETIVGEIEDEHNEDELPEIIEHPDGTVDADGRLDIDDFEERFGKILSEDERDENDTLGGLVCFIAGRVPAPGEIITHESGLAFEIRDSDPRKVNSLRIVRQSGEPQRAAS